MKKISFIILFLFVAIFAHAQQKVNYKLSPEVIKYFSGKWFGAGQFASGRKIEANLEYTASLDSAWISGNHQDVMPGRYKATLMWGCDRQSGEFVAYNFDNSQGHRRFSSRGWDGKSLILSADSENAKGEKVYEHFIYENF